MHLRDYYLKVSDTDSVVCALSDFLGPIVHCIEFTDLIGVAHLLKKLFDLFPSSH